MTRSQKVEFGKVVKNPLEAVQASRAALLLPHFGLQAEVGPPSIARQAHPANVTASLGRTARLRCRIVNLGQKSVRNQGLFDLINVK